MGFAVANQSDLSTTRKLRETKAKAANNEKSKREKGKYHG